MYIQLEYWVHRVSKDSIVHPISNSNQITTLSQTIAGIFLDNIAPSVPINHLTNPNILGNPSPHPNITIALMFKIAISTLRIEHHSSSIPTTHLMFNPSFYLSLSTQVSSIARLYISFLEQVEFLLIITKDNLQHLTIRIVLQKISIRLLLLYPMATWLMIIAANLQYITQSLHQSIQIARKLHPLNTNSNQLTPITYQSKADSDLQLPLNQTWELQFRRNVQATLSELRGTR